MTGHHTNNDQLGLANKWFTVPKEVPRPKSAVEWDRKGGIARDKDISAQASYWRSTHERNAERQKNRKRNDQSS